MKSLLLLVVLIGAVSAVQDCFEEDNTLQEVRALLGCKDCSIKNVDPLVWSGTATNDNKGGGWDWFRLDQVQYNVPDALQNKYYKHDANKYDVIIQRNGIYKIHHLSMAHCDGNCGMWSRVMINGGCRDYWHWSNAVSTRTNVNSLYMNLNANDRVAISIHAGGSNPYRYKKNANHLQLSYVGNKEEVVFLSAGCSGHVRFHWWKRLCLNHLDFKNQKTQQFLDHFSDGRIVVLKSGFYRIIGRALIHGHTGDKIMNLRVNNVNRASSESHNHQWAHVQVDISLGLKEDDVVELWTRVVGHDPYTTHTHQPTGHHSEIQIVRLGDLGDYDFTDQSSPNQMPGAVKLLSGGPSTVARDNKWHTLKIERTLVNSMPSSEVDYDANSGVFTVNTEGWYRFHAVAQMYSDGDAGKFGKLTVAGKVVQKAQMSNAAWQNVALEHTFKGQAGDTFQADFKTDGTNPQILNFHKNDGHTYVEVEKLEW